MSGRWLLMVTLLMMAVLLGACGGGSGTSVPAVPSGPKDPGGTGDSGGSAPKGTTGVITGEIDGEQFTVYTFLVDDGAGGQANMATWQDWREFDAVDVDLVGRRTGPFDFNGSVMIELNLDGNFELKPAVDPGNLPYNVTYWVSLTNAYLLRDATVIVDEAELIDADTLKLSGTFSGTLENLTGDTKELTNGKFEIENVSQVGPFS